LASALDGNHGQSAPKSGRVAPSVAIGHAFGVDFPQIAAELIRARRGNRTQKGLSRLLGYKSNVVFAWENGRDEPSAAAFFALAQRTGAGALPAALPGVRGPLPDLTSAPGVAELGRQLAGDRSLRELAELLGTDRHRVGRWLRGQTALPLSTLLQLFEVTTLRLLDVLAMFVDPSEMPSVRAEYERLVQARETALRLPWAHALVHMADLPSYRALPHHEPGWFASRLGITVREEAECLEHLVQSGQLELKGGRYSRSTAQNVDTRMDPQGTRRLAAFWLSEGARRVLQPGGGRFSFNTFAVSKKDLAKLAALQGEYFQKLRTIVDQSDPTEAVAVATFQLIPLAVEP
jgi:transcriptional regulator with XRE-family HTH domain